MPLMYTNCRHKTRFAGCHRCFKLCGSLESARALKHGSGCLGRGRNTKCCKSQCPRTVLVGVFSQHRIELNIAVRLEQWFTLHHIAPMLETRPCCLWPVHGRAKCQNSIHSHLPSPPAIRTGLILSFLVLCTSLCSICSIKC